MGTLTNSKSRKDFKMKHTLSVFTERYSKPPHYINIYFRDIIFVSAYNELSSEMFLIELPKPKSLEVLVSFDNDYNKLCDNLDI